MCVGVTCIAYRVCDVCIDQDVTKESVCEKCGRNRWEFYGENCMTEFGEWLMSPSCYESTCIAHNFNSFDSYPVMKFFWDHSIKPKVISNGCKIMHMYVKMNDLHFKDSLLFMPLP